MERTYIAIPRMKINPRPQAYRLLADKLLAYDIAHLEQGHILKKGKGMFIARENEINELESRYQSRNLEFAIIYGRRRIGKTRLIEEFAKDKRFFPKA